MKMLTPAELAERWVVTYGFLRDQRAAGEGPDYIKLGKGKRSHVRYPLEAVEAYERQQAKSSNDVMGVSRGTDQRERNPGRDRRNAAAAGIDDRGDAGRTVDGRA